MQSLGLSLGPLNRKRKHAEPRGGNQHLRLRKPAWGWNQSTEKSSLQNHREQELRSWPNSWTFQFSVSNKSPLPFKLVQADFWLLLLGNILKHPYLLLSHGAWNPYLHSRALPQTCPHQVMVGSKGVKVRCLNQRIPQESSGDNCRKLSLTKQISEFHSHFISFCLSCFPLFFISFLQKDHLPSRYVQISQVFKPQLTCYLAFETYPDSFSWKKKTAPFQMIARSPLCVLPTLCSPQTHSSVSCLPTGHWRVHLLHSSSTQWLHLWEAGEFSDWEG